ncbi:MAG: polymer-forming cytoskeletal protein [Spirochaetales bacterium]|nr:polymer-forming cytoskeletal protein [Spirochaetales bacterium]
MPDVRIKKIDENEIDTILADDIDFSGVVSFEKPLMVKGRINGEINANGDLYVDEGALVDAEIKANMVSAKGKINGNIAAKSKVELFATAVVTGDIVSPKIEIETGATFNGNCIMKGGNEQDTYEQQ